MKDAGNKESGQNETNKKHLQHARENNNTTSLRTKAQGKSNYRYMNKKATEINTMTKALT